MPVDDAGPDDLPGPATPEDPFKGHHRSEDPGGDWRAYCPSCGEQAVQLPEDVDLGESKPWMAVQGRLLSYDTRDYYCDGCGCFVNLKDADVWHRGSRN